MSEIHVIGGGDCGTCRRSLELLALTGRSLRWRELMRDPLTRDELRSLAGLSGGVRHLLSVQAPAYKARGLGRPEIGEPELLSLMASDPSLVRRPIVRFDGVVLVGFDGELPASTDGGA